MIFFSALSLDKDWIDTCASLPLNDEEDEEDLNPEEDEYSNIPGKMLEAFFFLN